MTTTRTLPASYVTRVLRREGHTVLPAETPRSRQGTRVSQGHNAATVTVVADFDVDAMGARRAAQIRETLEGLGFVVTVNPESVSILTVARPTTEEPTMTDPRPTRDDDYTPEAIDRDADADEAEPTAEPDE